GDNRETKPVFSGACGFNGGVQGQEVGLLGEIVNDFDDFADIVGALSQHVNDFARRLDGNVDFVQSVGRFLHGGDAAVHFFTGAVGNIQQHFRGVGDALNGSNHLVDGCGSLAYARSLYLRALHHVLHVHAHL